MAIPTSGNSGVGAGGFVLRRMRCVVRLFHQLDRERTFQEFSLAGLHSTGESETDGAGCGSPRIRILLADSHQPIRIAAADILSTKCKAEVIGVASDGAQAIDDVLRLKPDILVLEIVLPVVDGIRVTRVLSSAKIQTRILILTAMFDGSFQLAALEAGAHAYVSKVRMLTDLPLAIKAILEGQTFCSPPQI